MNTPSNWSLRESDLPGIQPVVRYVDSRGRHVTIEEMHRSPGQYRWTIEDRDSVPRAAIEKLDAGLKAGSESEFRKAMDLLLQSHLLCPRWANPVYQGAWTALLLEDTALARTLYGWVDRMVPDGYWTTKTALDCLNREATGEFPAGIYRAYVLLEFEADRVAMVEQLVKQFPSFAPGWKDLAAMRESAAGREEAIAKGLAARPDRETKCFLLIHQATLLNSKGKLAEKRALVQDLIDGTEGTLQTKALARMFLVGTEERSK